MKANKLSLIVVGICALFAVAAIQGCTGSEAAADTSQVRQPGADDPKPEGETGAGGTGSPSSGSSEAISTSP